MYMNDKGIFTLKLLSNFNVSLLLINENTFKSPLGSPNVPSYRNSEIGMYWIFKYVKNIDRTLFYPTIIATAPW